MMFSTVVATGDDVWMPSSGTLPPEDKNEVIVSEDDDNMQTVTRSNGRRKRLSLDDSSTMQTSKISGKNKGKGVSKEDRLLDYVKELADTARVNAPPARSSTIKEAYEELGRIPEIYDDMDFNNFATEFVLDKSKREGFMNCPTERKVWWLRSRYLKSLN